ncbi:MAG: hypothetical protein LLF94_01075 [Chlamydiales bacterium]|nr:hypothetical protein [Chlamydiales bacterium]
MVNVINFASIGQRVMGVTKTVSPWVGVALTITVVTVALIKVVDYFRGHSGAQVAPRRMVPINEVRSYFAQSIVLPAEAQYTQDAALYKDVAQLISGHLGLADVASLARLNRIWHSAAQPVLRNRTQLNDALSYGLETAWNERKERQITQKVYYDKQNKAFYVFNNYLGDNPEVVEIGNVSVKAKEEPTQIQLGQNSAYILKLSNIIFTSRDNIAPDLRAKGREFQALCSLI